MGLNYKVVLASSDITGSPVLMKKFRGKTAKEIYRCGKGILFTGSLAKPIVFAAATIPAELSKGIVYTAVGQIGEATIGYLSGFGFIRYIYKIAEPGKFKATARIIYNVSSLPLTIYSKGVGGVFDLLKLSKLEKAWFGEPVYIFDDNRIWVEKNFTLMDGFKTVE